MANGYPIEPLGNYASVQGGFAFKSGDFKNSGIPVLKIKNVRLRDVDISVLEHVDNEVARDASRYFCKTGDLLISMTGSGPQAPNSVVGRVARFTGPSDRFLINQRVGRFVIKEPSKLDGRYLFFVLTQEEYQWSLVSIATGSANQANISAGQIERLEIPLPPLHEQRAIASVLGALDDKIALNQRMNETLEALAQSLFKAWFVDATQDGLPKGWRESALGELVELRVDRVEATQAKDGERYIALEDMPSKSIDLSNYQPGNAVNSSIIAFRKGDILFGSMRPYFHKVGLTFYNGITRTTTFVLRPRHKRLRHFALFHFFSSEVVEFATTASVGTTIPYVKWDTLERYQIALPPESCLEAFEKAVAPLVQRIAANGDESRTLAALRDVLVPKLLSGEVRLPPQMLRQAGVAA